MHTCSYFSRVCITMHGSENVKFVCYVFCFIVPIHRLHAQNSLLSTIHKIFTCIFSFSVSTIAWTHLGYNLTDCLEIWKIYCRRVFESPGAQNRGVTASLSWTGTAARNLVSIFTIFEQTKDNLLFIFSFHPTVWHNFLG